jgi:hypothetical protein
MAKGNMLQGQATGKVGDIVFMVRNGQQVARVYTSAGGRSGDQASIAVRRQRVRFGAASNQYLLYRNIVRGMYRTGKNTRQSDYNFFVRENVDLLPYLTREENAAGVKCVMPGTFSRGTLGSMSYSIDWTGEDDTSEWNITLSGFEAVNEFTWGGTVANFKALLKTIFPNARKVNFSVSHILRSELDLPNGSQWSHTLERGDVVFDLYEEDTTVPNTAKVYEYFAHYVPSFFASSFNDQIATIPIVTGNYIFHLEYGNGWDDDDFRDLMVQIFASNDQVGDCYTATLSALNVPDSDGGLSLYSTLRTDDHRQVAEDSYGYATGVMRTNIQQA